MRAISGQGLDILGLSNDLKEKEDVSILGIQAGCPRLQLHHHWRGGIEREEMGARRSIAGSYPPFATRFGRWW
jgi:hypothetical protein